METFDVFEFIDNINCTPNDSSVQYIRFTNNTVSFNLVEDVLNSLDINHNNINKRYKEVIISNNTYTGMLGATQPFVNIYNNEPGVIRITDNYFYNCSATTDFFVVYSQDEIIFQNNKFESLELFTKGIISTSNALVVSLSGLEFTEILHNANSVSDYLVKISTRSLGNCTIDNSVFHDNIVRTSVISIDSTVGILTFTNNRFYKDIIKSVYISENVALQQDVYYIKISNPYSMMFDNVTFTRYI